MCWSQLCMEFMEFLLFKKYLYLQVMFSKYRKRNKMCTVFFVIYVSLHNYIDMF